MSARENVPSSHSRSPRADSMTGKKRASSLRPASSAFGSAGGFQYSFTRSLVLRKTFTQAGVRWPVWNKSQRCTEARLSSESGIRRDAGRFSATYQQIEVDFQMLSAPLESAGTFYLGFGVWLSG